jgi:sugar (pentulose or hexulose) kinase
VVDTQGRIQVSRETKLAALSQRDAVCKQTPELWWSITRSLLRAVLQEIPGRNVVAIAVDGTSGTVLPIDGKGAPLGPALMYNDARAIEEADGITRQAPAAGAVQGPTSGLAKFLWLKKHVSWTKGCRILNQADWIMGHLLGRYGISDENNCLKLGYDPVQRTWPTWLGSLDLKRNEFPEVYPAGHPVGRIDRSLAGSIGFPHYTQIVTGTTDSVAGLVATGACEPGDAVTSLGSTLVLKVISTVPVFSQEHGVYSHRLGDLWLVGGASNCGGAVLKQYFTQTELDEMETLLQPDRPTELAYYPLPSRGERFPVADPNLVPRLTPRPKDPVRFFQGILEGIARVEKLGYERLQALGAPCPLLVRTVGKGAHNRPWSTIRRNLLGLEVIAAKHTEAAYGTALLARNGIMKLAHNPSVISHDKTIL